MDADERRLKMTVLKVFKATWNFSNSLAAHDVAQIPFICATNVSILCAAQRCCRVRCVRTVLLHSW